MPNSSPTICFLSANHPAQDKRVFDKEACSLREAGYSVIHICPGDSRAEHEISGIHIHEYPRHFGIVGRFCNLWKLMRLGWSCPADAYHCNEPDSWAVGILLKLFRRKPVVFDCHEYYPGQVTRRLPKLLHPLARVLMHFCLQGMGLVTDLIVLAKYSVEKDFTWSNDRVIVAQNTTPLAALTKRQGQEIEKRTHGPFTFVHLGVIRRERGSEQLLEAITVLAKNPEKHFQVVIIGEFKDGSEQSFFEKARQNSVDSLIEFHRWMPFAEAFEKLCQADCGLVLFQRHLANNVFGLPHKMFDYMLAKLPVIAPDFAPEIAHIIEESNAGLLIDTADVNALAAAMNTLVKDRELARVLGANGQRAVFETYNWERDAAKLIAGYEELFTKKGLRLPNRQPETPTQFVVHD